MGCLKLSYYQTAELKIISSKKVLTLEKTKKNLRSSYFFGFNGKLKDDEIKGSGNSYDFGARIYDPRLGRWLSLDPLQKKYPSWSPYNAMLNNPISLFDPDGKRVRPVNKGASVAYNSLLRTFGTDEQLGEIFNIRFKRNTFYSQDINALSKKDFLKRARKGGVRISKSQRASAYSTYLSLADKKVVELETIKASTTPTTRSAGQKGTTLGKAAYDLNVNPSLMKLQSDIKQAGSATPNIVNELFNPKDPKNPRYPAKLRGNNFVFFKGVSPASFIKGSGGIKGTIELNTTNEHSPSQTANTINKAIQKLYPDK